MYSQLAKGYEELYKEEQEEKLAILVKYLKVKKTDLLLDVGCGTGISTQYFPCKSVGIDPCKEMRAQGKGNLKEGSAENIPFPDKTFDVVISITALHHADLTKALQEIKRVAKPNAQIALTLLKKTKDFPKRKKTMHQEFANVQEIDAKKDILFLARIEG